jgi:hypothetical protein
MMNRAGDGNLTVGIGAGGVNSPICWGFVVIAIIMMAMLVGDDDEDSGSCCCNVDDGHDDGDGRHCGRGSVPLKIL